MKLLITGASGLLGQKTARLALKKGHDVYSFYKEHQTNLGTSIKANLTNEVETSKIISKLSPEAIIHTAAYTDVDGCETNRDLAWKINAQATRNIAITSTSINAHVIYVSTDYVFDGEKGLYTEEDTANPINYYAYTKLKGEEFVKENATKWCIARSSVIYGWSAYKQNFATWLINSLHEKKEVKALKDQYVSPTLNTNLAQMLLEVAEREITGILHTAGDTRVSRFEYALKLGDVFNLDKELIKPAKMDEMPWKAKRPRDSSLNVSKARTILDSKPLKLNQALKVMKKEKKSILK